MNLNGELRCLFGILYRMYEVLPEDVLTTFRLKAMC